uniref:Calponin-homology (CH) domain-containing protein n=1 Tax=Kalanchoe fedtschenkoi TaxID=63787 RepID=A0A7N0TP12_KALFE
MKTEDQTPALLKDISNFRTPKRPTKTTTYQSPYSASVFRSAKQTPAAESASTLRRRQSILPSAARSKAARRLKAIELEQSQSSRKAQVQRERSLKLLSKSLAAWLNFLFENPRGCGCEGLGEKGVDVRNGKRDSGEGGGRVGVDEEWRNPKRYRDSEWSAMKIDGAELLNAKMFSALRGSLEEVCSFDDLLQRMRTYLSLDSCKEIFNMMTHVTKEIDQGRMKMKAHCPIVTDFGMKEKATNTLLCYNPIWLRIGLYLIFGGDSLLPDENVNIDQEIGLLKMVIEKQFFSHAGLAKKYAYNKKVEGLYRPGYFEALGAVILKRFLLLALILDRAKSQRTLPLKLGIDGIDGGSPLLFTVTSSVKASRQMVHEFLSTNVMHGEGNIIIHLEMVRYKVTYLQEPLLEYHFRVSDIFEDLQDGVLICRAVQLLRHDSSSLMRLAVPSDTHKKKLSNCSVALQYLKQANTPLHDDDGVSILSEDIAQGDKELTISLLWNMFVHLQIPLLVKESLFLEEIYRIHGAADGMTISVTDPVALLLSWVQVVCERYDCHVKSFTSLVDGKAMWCLLDYYFRKELNCSCAHKDLGDPVVVGSVVSASDYTDGIHNFILSQKLTSLLGNFPEVLQISDILEFNGVCNEQCVMILLVFLSSELIVKRNTDQLNFHKILGCTCRTVDRKRSGIEQPCLAKINQIIQPSGCEENDDFVSKFRAIKAWWQDMTQLHYKRDIGSASSMEKDSVNITTLVAHSTDVNTTTQREIAALVIQCYVKCSIARKNYLRIKGAVCFLQIALSARLAARSKYVRSSSSLGTLQITNDRLKESEIYQSYFLFMDERLRFILFKRSALLIQRAVRSWISRRKSRRAAQIAATTLQCHFRRWLVKKRFCNEKQAAIAIQRNFRQFRSWKALQLKITTRAATIIQSQYRAWCSQRDFRRRRHHVIIIQSHARGWLARRRFLKERKSAVKIQNLWRDHRMIVKYNCYRQAAIEIQCHVRGWISRKRLLGYSCPLIDASNLGTFDSSGFLPRSSELNMAVVSIIKLQRWWRDVLLRRLKNDAAILIQSHIRGWLARRRAVQERSQIVLIQSHWKGYLARKGSKQDLVDLRSRVQKSATNIDDSKRLMNRLLAALAELLSMKSISGILHTCETLDTATKHSQKCCEELVAAGAVNTLLKLIQSVSRSIPDQEVLKYALSTLRNLARYPHLAISVINADRSVEIILREMLRNKEDAYFNASELLKKICSIPEGAKAVRNLPGLMKRLHSHIEDLTRKITLEKRKPRANLAAKENMEKRLRESSEILSLAAASR